MAEPDWSLWRAFLAVMEAGSLSAAGRALGLAQPTVGRQIEALERALGDEALFTRSPGGLKPTRAAQALKPHAEAMAAAAAALVRTAAGEEAAMTGVARITAGELVGAELLPPILTRFHEAWPGMEIELSLSNRIEDLLRRDADIAVRMTRPTQGALLARRVCVTPIHMHAHRDYLARRGTPRTLAELAGHTLIGFDRAPPPLEGLEALPFTVTRDLFAARTDSDLAQLALLCAGFGVCPCQPAIAANHPGLAPLLEDEFRMQLEVWVVMHEDLKGDRRLKALFDHLARGLAAAYAGGDARGRGDA